MPVPLKPWIRTTSVRPAADTVVVDAVHMLGGLTAPGRRVVGVLADSRDSFSIDELAERTGADDIPEILAYLNQVAEAFGYQPAVGFEEGLKRTVDWYKDAFARQLKEGAPVS